jgi:hypothetical protein
VKRVVLLIGIVSGLAVVPTTAQAKCGLGCLASRISSLQSQVGSMQGQVSSLNGQVSSLSGQVSSLQGQLAAADRTLGTITNCLAETPVTQYGDPSGTFGYVFSNDGFSSFFTSALDGTAPGHHVGAWFLVDSCNTRTTAVAHTAHMARGTLGPEGFWVSHGRK